MKKKQQNVIILSIIIVVILLVIAEIFLQKQSVVPLPPISKLTPTLSPLQLTEVPVTSESNQTQTYRGTTFAVTFPSPAWKATVAYDCGEDDIEKVVLYYQMDPVGSTTPRDTITLCANDGKANPDSFISYINQKIALQDELRQKQIDTLTEETVAGEKTLVSEVTRQDFPGHYEKTLFLQKNMTTYRIIWSIEANSTDEEMTLYNATNADYQKIIASFTPIVR